MDVEFPYEFEGEGFFGEIYRPIAKVSLQSQKSGIWSTIWMVVDTGADFTILPRYVSKSLEIDLEKDCLADKTKGVGGQQTVYLYRKKVKAAVGSFKRKIPLAFFDNDGVPPLLGRLGFLETFEALFSSKHAVTFSSHD